MPFLGEPTRCDFGDGQGCVSAFVWYNLKGGRGGLVAATSNLHPSVELSADSSVGSEVEIGPNVRVIDGSNVKYRAVIGEGSFLRAATIGARSRIGADTNIQEAQVGPDCSVEADAELLGSTLANGAKVGTLSSIASCRIGAAATVGNQSTLSGVVVDDAVTVPTHTCIQQNPIIYSHKGIIVQQPDTSWGARTRASVTQTPARNTPTM